MVGYVYLVWEKDTSFYKIGETKNLKERLATLQTANANPLIMLAKIEAEDPKRKESYLHDKYDPFARKGEWFNIPPQLIAELLADFSVACNDCPDTPVYFLLSKAREMKSLIAKYRQQLLDQSEVIGRQSAQLELAAAQARQDVRRG